MVPVILRIRHSGGLYQHCFPEVMLVYTMRNLVLCLVNIDKMPTLLYFLEQQIKPGLIVENDDNYYN